MPRFAFVLKQFRLEDEGLKPRRGQSNFINARIEHSLLSTAGMEFSVFTNATILNTNFIDTKLQYCHFIGANLIHCDLSGSIIHFSELEDAKFRHLNLAGVDLSLAKNLTQTQINDSFGALSGDSETKLPEQLSSPDHWYDPHTDEADYFEKMRLWRAASEVVAGGF